MDTNYQDNSLEDWHRLQEEEIDLLAHTKSINLEERNRKVSRILKESTMSTNEEPKKILLTIGELRAALEPFGEDTEIRFEVSGMSAVFGENLCAAALTISADAVFVELLPFFEPEDE